MERNPLTPYLLILLGAVLYALFAYAIFVAVVSKNDLFISIKDNTVNTIDTVTIIDKDTIILKVYIQRDPPKGMKIVQLKDKSFVIKAKDLEYPSLGYGYLDCIDNCSYCVDFSLSKSTLRYRSYNEAIKVAHEYDTNCNEL
jgi:hypothetical protein